MKPDTFSLNTAPAAYRALARGWAIHPCLHSVKRPATWHGFEDASKDPRQINTWFGDTSVKNIGIRTGDASGVVVIDLDFYKPGAVQSFDGLIESLGCLPDTYTVRTRAGGLHLYYRMPKGMDLRSYNRQLATGIDLRANGGYVIGAGSYVEEDKSGPAGMYVEIERDIADLPDAWIKAWLSLNARQDAIAARKAAKELTKQQLALL